MKAKKVMAMAMASAMILSLTACGGGCSKRRRNTVRRKSDGKCCGAEQRRGKYGEDR